MPPSDKFWAEYKELSSRDFMAVTTKQFAERFMPEFRREAFDALSDFLRSTLPEDSEQDEDLLSVADFVERTGDPPPMIAEGILSPNSLILLTARPKQGKTFFCLQIADDIASGKPLLGKFPVPQPGPVVYFAMEGSKQQWKQRIVQRGMDVRNPPVYIYTGRKDFSTAEGIEWMIKKVAPVGPSVIIIDTARQALNMEQWNDADKVNARIRPLVDAVQQRGSLTLPDGCCIILVHHNNKNTLAEGGDKISGSNALQSNSDGYIIIDHKKRLANGNLQAKAECEGRTDMLPEFMWEMDTETLQVKVLEDAEAEAATAAARQANFERHFPQIEFAIKQHDGAATLGEISIKTGMARSLVHRVIKTMVEKGQISESGTRPSKRGAPSSLYIINSTPYMGEQLNKNGVDEADERAKKSVDDFYAETPKPEDNGEWVDP